MKKATKDRKMHIGLVAALMAFAMAAAALPAIASDGYYVPVDGIEVSTWGELRDAIDTDLQSLSVVLTGDIIDNSDSDAIKIKGDRFISIYMDGHKIDRQRGAYGTYDGRLFEISGAGTRVEFFDGTLAGGHGDGGCLHIDNANIVELNNVTVTDNFSDGDGGAIYVKHTEIVVNGGKIADNTCHGDGGAIYIKDDSAITIKDAEICGNYARFGSGGAMYVDESAFAIMNCNFHENYCTEDAGAIYVDGDTDFYAITSGIESTTFTKNHAGDDEDCDGGAIYMKDAVMTIDRSTFDGNYCGFNGGAILCEDSDLMIYSTTTFKNNNAPDSGGALGLYGGNHLFVDTSYEGNHANSCGGAVYINDEAQVKFSGTTKMTGNSVLMDGGGLLVGADGENTVEIDGVVVIKDNTASRNGPNVFIRAGERLYCGAFGDGSEVWVVMAEGDGEFTYGFGATNPNLDSAKIFHSDDANYYVANDGGEAKLFKSNTGGDMSDNTVWIAIGAIVAVIAVAGALFYVLKVRKSKSA